MSAFNFYALEQDKGFPGMKADVTNDDVLSYASEGGVNPGEPVVLGTDPDKQVKTASAAGDGEKVIGVAVHTHKDPNETGKYYEDGYCLPVMAKGDIYVEAGADITAGNGAAIYFSGSDVVWLNAGDTFDTSVAGSNTYQVVTNAADSDVVVFGGESITGGTDFTVGADASATATNIAAAFGNDSVLNGTYSFTASSDTITITELSAGGGDTPGGMTFTGTVSIVGGSATTSTVNSSASESIAGATYLESGSEGDVVKLRILK